MKKLAFAAFAALITLVSCNKEIAPKEEVPAVKDGATITIKARSTEVKTNIVATQSGDEWTYKAHWNDEGESLGLILFTGDDFAASDVPVELAGSKSGDDMIFSGSSLDFEDGTYNIFLFYPFEAYQSSADGFIVGELKASQSPVKGSIDPKGDLLGYIDGGLVIDGGQATIEDVELQRINAILRINLNAEDGDIAYGEVVTGLKMEVPSVLPLAGKVSIESDGGFDIVEGASAITASIAAEEQISIGAAGDDNAVYLVTLPVTIPQDSPITFTIETTAHNGENAISRTVNAKEAMKLREGKVNTIDLKVRDGDIEDARYAGGTGIEGDPWLIATSQHMLNMAEDMLSATETLYFKLIDDIDMDGVEWPRINPDSPYNPIDLDGNHKTISNLGKSLFYVLNGAVKDLSFKSCSITQRGVLAEYIQGTGHSVTNVNVSNCTVNYNNTNPGGLIGTINQGSGTTATISNCTVSNTNVTGTGVVGGLIGFADALVIIDGCTYTGGKVKASSARYCGGLLGSTGNYDSIISDCHVEKATIESAVNNNDFRVGGLIGQQQAKVTVKGCSVGTASDRVKISLAAPTSGKVYNAGGFVGVQYGTITKNDDGTRSSAYVTITAGNTETGKQMNLGGFAGYNTGTIEYSDADVVMTGLKGSHIGGFCGILLQSGKIRNCTEIGSVEGNNYTGGFVGAIDSSVTEIDNCTSAGSVSGQSSVAGFAGGSTSANNHGTFTNNSSTANVTATGSNVGGFIGNGAGTFTSNHATGTVASSGGGSIGGFAGGIWDASTGSTFSKNYATGDVSGNANCGGLIGYIGGNLTMSDCYATGNVGNSSKYNQKYGGLVGFTTDDSEKSTSIKISNCYATGDIEPSFAGGGLIGRIGLASCSVSKCAAWNGTIAPHSVGANNWSSGAVVGVTFPTCTLTDNYRNPAMSLSAYWVPADMTSFQHPDVSSTHPLTDSTGAEMTDASNASSQPHFPQYPYHGHVESGKNLSQLASTTLGWSSDIWDFNGPIPLLK